MVGGLGFGGRGSGVRGSGFGGRVRGFGGLGVGFRVRVGVRGWVGVWVLGFQV